MMPRGLKSAAPPSGIAHAQFAFRLQGSQNLGLGQAQHLQRENSSKPASSVSGTTAVVPVARWPCAQGIKVKKALFPWNASGRANGVFEALPDALAIRFHAVIIDLDANAIAQVPANVRKRILRAFVARGQAAARR